MTVEIDFRISDHAPYKRIVWATDLHFDAADVSQYRLFVDLLIAYAPDAILIGGDISNGPNSLMHLQHLSKYINKPIYFVLGNHDFYYTSISQAREKAHVLSQEQPAIKYLTDGGVFALSSDTGLIGHDGWSDGRAGDFLHSTILLNDYFLIEEFKKLNQEERLAKLNSLGTEAAEYFRKILKQALEAYDYVIALTHVPPFVEACLYGGKVCDANWAPHFVGVAMGQVFKEVMEQNPSKQLMVLCGHSHNGSELEVLPNLRVVTGQTELGVPNIQGLLFIN